MILHFFRLAGRAAKSYTINIDASKVAYHTSENDVKIYMETTSNGVQKGGKEYNKVRHKNKLLVTMVTKNLCMLAFWAALCI